jgi:hypothetical protein
MNEERKSCITCKWDFKGNFTSELFFPCLQGHVRVINLGQVISIEDCHAWEDCHDWEEKEKCECRFFYSDSYFKTVQSVFTLKCKKCGRVIE